MCDGNGAEALFEADGVVSLKYCFNKEPSSRLRRGYVYHNGYLICGNSRSALHGALLTVPAAAPTRAALYRQHRQADGHRGDCRPTSCHPASYFTQPVSACLFGLSACAILGDGAIRQLLEARISADRS